MFEIARKMRGPDGAGRVMVFDVNHSSVKHRVHLRERASRHAYYLRPPKGMNASDLKSILDEAGGEDEFGFRYYVYPELETDLKPLITADPYAEKYFDRDEDRRFLQIQGERPKAREAIAELLEGLKQPFNSDEFPRIHEFSLKLYRPATLERQAEVVLLRKDGDKNELRKSEPGFHVAVAEHGLAGEIDIHRPMVAESEPVLILNSNEHTGDLGCKFLSDFADYFGTPSYAEQSIVVEKEAREVAKVGGGFTAPAHLPHEVFAPRIQPLKMDEGQMLARAALAIKEQSAHMNLLQKREATSGGPHITIRFPGVLGFGKGPSEKEIRELEAVYRSVKGDPSFGSNWYAHYLVDGKTGELKVTTSLDPNPPKGWIAFR